MSTSAVVNAIAPTGPVSRRVRAYFAPVNRLSETATIFDASEAASFQLGSPPTPWMDLGWIANFERKSDAKIAAVSSGAPGLAQYQVRQTAGATVSFSFEQWTKLTMALACGSENMNVLAPASAIVSFVHCHPPPPHASGAAANGSGGAAGTAQSIVFGGSMATSATVIALDSADLANYDAGSLVAVDLDYAGQLGFVGSGVSAAYVKSAASVNSDPDYVRRVTFNVARVQQVTAQGLLLAQPLPAGVPVAGMKAQPVLGFVDREGGSFLQEWSALFVMACEQGDAVFFYYPRLQGMAGAAETASVLQKPLERVALAAAFRALPVVDAVDGQQVFCFRTYVPGAFATV
jgi:hypothetical protein